MEIEFNSPKHGIHKVIIDDEDYELIKNLKWNLVKDGNTYYVISSNPNLRLHRFIMESAGNEINNKYIDHIDGDGLNNSKSNLRICCNSENQRNRRIETQSTLNSSSRYKGVRKSYRKKNPWRSDIRLPTGKLSLGNFLNEEKAAKAYDIAAIKYFKEFACLNFPELKEEYLKEIKND